MITDLKHDDVVVTCSCGAQTIIASGWMVDSIVCGVCGCRVPLRSSNVRAKASTASAIFQRAVKGDLCYRMRMAARFVKEEKFDEAIALYEEVLAEQPQHRDALYGWGYIHYKRGELQEALACLRQAESLGHPTAGRLLRRISERLGALDSDPRPQAPPA